MKITKLEFVCLFNRLVPDINSDVLQMIYEEYTKTFYDKYTLFELISFLDVRNIYIVGILNKKNICNIVADNAPDIPDKSHYDAYNKTKWKLFNLRYIDYITYPNVTHVNKNIICIQDIQARFEIMAGDMFFFNEKEYKIDTINDDRIILHAYNEKAEYELHTFITMLDTDEIAIMTNQVRSNTARHAYIERTMCMKQIATI
jgi:hypothetical protein